MSVLKSLFLSMMLLSTSLIAEATKSNAVWGRVVKSEKTIKGVSYKYFIYFEKDGKAEAYPLETKNKQIAQTIEQNVNSSVHVEGDVKDVTLNLDGPKQKILVFSPTSIKPLTLSALAINEPVEILQTKPGPATKAKASYDGGGIRLNDKVTNALIYTGSALMIGNALKGTFSK